VGRTNCEGRPSGNKPTQQKWRGDAAPEIRKNLLDGSQVRNVGWADDEGKRGAVSEMRQDLLNYCQVRDDGCMDEDAGGAVSEVVKGAKVK